MMLKHEVRAWRMQNVWKAALYTKKHTKECLNLDCKDCQEWKIHYDRVEEARTKYNSQILRTSSFLNYRTQSALLFARQLHKPKQKLMSNFWL